MIARQSLFENGVTLGLALVTSAGLLVCLAVPAAAQSLPIDRAGSGYVEEAPPATQSEGLENMGRTADTGIGEVGERTSAIVNVDPMGRLESRIQNRVQNRIRNRIDRNYDPMANATSPFERADQQTRRGASR